MREEHMYLGNCSLDLLLILFLVYLLHALYTHNSMQVQPDLDLQVSNHCNPSPLKDSLHGSSSNFYILHTTYIEHSKAANISDTASMHINNTQRDSVAKPLCMLVKSSLMETIQTTQNHVHIGNGARTVLPAW